MTTSNKNPFNDLDKKFNTKEVTKALERNLKEREDERKKQLPDVAISDEDRQKLLAKQQEEDFQYARSILKQAEAYNDEAIQGILHIARNSDQPRAYEVAGGLIKNLQDTAKDMIDVQERQKRVTADDPNKKGNIKTQNNLFVGSTKDLLSALKKEDDTKIINVEKDDTSRRE